MFRTWLFLLSIPAALCLPHDHQVKRALPNVWYQPPDHPVHQLFRRDATTDGVVYAAVGSQEWSQAFPPGVPDNSTLPQAWVDALNDAIAAGQIPDIPTTTLNGNPYYPNGLNPTDPSICSSTYGCRATNDIWDAPDGVIGIGFDDGPSAVSELGAGDHVHVILISIFSQGSSTLYPFLQQNNIRATHFMIGINILNQPDLFTTAYEDLQDDIAVHTWTHPYMVNGCHDSLFVNTDDISFRLR
jgi:chitin deacetylase